MHPVARVSIKYWNTSVRNKFFGARCIVHFTLNVHIHTYIHTCTLHMMLGTILWRFCSGFPSTFCYAFFVSSEVHAHPAEAPITTVTV
jgi:hypothetical protein